MAQDVVGRGRAVDGAHLVAPSRWKPGGPLEHPHQGPQNEWNPELEAEGPSRCTIELEPVDSSVKLTVTHEIERPESRLITAVSGGWPRILSNLKSLLETGEIAITSHPGH